MHMNLITSHHKEYSDVLPSFIFDIIGYCMTSIYLGIWQLLYLGNKQVKESNM